MYSIYSYKRIRELWKEGNPFAWHLRLESRLLFSFDGNDYLKALGSPSPYIHCVRDCQKFLALFREGYDSVVAGKPSVIFDLSTIFLSIRTFASCFSLGIRRKPDFSRNSALCLGTRSLQLSPDSYRVLERTRILCTRGHGSNIGREEVISTVQQLDGVWEWMNKLLEEAKKHGRI